MQLEDIRRLIEADYQEYQKTLSNAVVTHDQYLNEINKFILSNSGKELRPILAILAARVCGSINQLCYEVAAVSQMLHNATLMHDDVVDEALTRRGSPTVGAKFTNGTAVLMGDFWLSRGLLLLSKSFNKEILVLFATVVETMAQGELIQLEKSAKVDTTQVDYFNIIEAKTSQLFVASMVGGAKAAEAEPSKIEGIKEYALHLGNAFQIRDDILDYSPTNIYNKTSGLDIKEKKITLPLLCAFKNNPQKEQEIRELIRNNKSEVFAPVVLDFVQKNNGIPDAQKILESERDTAIEALSLFEDGEYKEALVLLAKYVGSREL